MPRIVDELPKTSRGRTKKYHWEELYAQLAESGKAAELEQGEDFTCSGASIRQFLYRDSAENGFKVKVRNRKGENDRDIVTFSVEVSEDGKPEDKPETKATAKSGAKKS